MDAYHVTGYFMKYMGELKHKKCLLKSQTLDLFFKNSFYSSYQNTWFCHIEKSLRHSPIHIW
jgi:hypothetical protein